MKKTSIIDGTITLYPGIKAIDDAFGVVVDCTENFEAAQRLTLHIALPMLHQAMRKLSDVSSGCEVWREKGNDMSVASIYSQKLSAFVVQHLLSPIKHHPLLLVGCHLNPVFRRIEFTSDVSILLDFRSKADEFARSFYAH